MQKQYRQLHIRKEVNKSPALSPTKSVGYSDRRTLKQKASENPPTRHAAALYGQRKITPIVTPWRCALTRPSLTHTDVSFPLWVRGLVFIVTQ